VPILKSKGDIEMVAICVDAGTSVVKAVAFDEQGTEIAVAKHSVPILRTHAGWSEQDMNAVWNALVLTVRDVANAVATGVSFLAITAQGDGCWLIDDDGNPTGPAILWNDARATSFVEQWRKDGALEQAFRLNGTAAFPGSQCGILRWLQEHDPQRLTRSATALYCKDWLAFKLTGERTVEETDASFPFFDIRGRHYSAEMFRLYGLEWVQRLLPPVHESARPAGTLQPEVAASLGLPNGLPIVTAPYDIAATAIGLGVVHTGQAVSILGTTLCNEIVIDEVNTEGEPVGLLICSGVPRHWLRGFATMCGTETLDWLCQLFNIHHPSALLELASSVPPGAGGMMFMPYLSPAGERAPFLNPYARATMLGFSLEQSQAHIARAALEGLTFVIRECLEAASVTPTELSVCGGGAVSDLWCEMIADVTQLPVRTTTASEVGAKGAFFTGLVATGMEPNLEEAVQKYVKTRKLYQPHRTAAHNYEEQYQNFLALRDITAETWSRLATERARAERMRTRV
jgi:xylulokinase